MDQSFDDLPSEPRLSNSIWKSRPTPTARRKQNPTHATPLDGLHSNQNLDDSHVVFRTKNLVSANRNREAENRLLNSSDSTLFYVTSSTIENQSTVTCHSSPSSSLLFSTHDSVNASTLKDDVNTSTSSEVMNGKRNSVSLPSDDDDSIPSNKTMEHLHKVRQNSSNSHCADCDSQYPTIAITSWLLVICQECAAIHLVLTSNFLRLQSLLEPLCDPDLIDLLRDYGNKYSNSLLENTSSETSKPHPHSSASERKKYIRQKYLDKIYLRRTTSPYTQDQLDQILYENVETSDCKKTLYLLILGADPNYSSNKFPVADHAKRHQQIKQMKLVLANGGLSEFDSIQRNSDEITESAAYLSTKHGILKEFLTRYENDRLKIYARSRNVEKQQRCLLDIDLNNVLAICNQSVNAVALKCRLTTPPPSTVNVSSQCTLVVDEVTSSNEYVWVFPTELERSVWIREIIKRQYPYYQLIYSDFLLFMKLNIQEGINAEKQQVIAIVYSGRLVICSDTTFDEVDLRRYSSLTYQKSEQFIGVLLCLVSKNRFLYLSSPIVKLTDVLYSSLRQAIQVKTLTDLNQQILTSQNIPVIVERLTNFIFEHGLQTKGIYRQAGQETKIKQLLAECLENPFHSSLTLENYTEHEAANALKRFLRQLSTPLLGTRQNYHAWLRSTVDETMTDEQLIQYYRALLRDLKEHFPIHYSTLRTILIHIHTVAILADKNGMTISNLISTFTPCLVSQGSALPMDQMLERPTHRKMSYDANDRDTSAIDTEEKAGYSPHTPVLNKLRRNQSDHSPRHSMNSAQFSLSSSYAHVTPSIQGDLQIMKNLCRFYRELFDVTYEELEHEKICIETLVTMTNNQYVPRLLDGAMISVYFESRADELNGYAMNVFEDETTADMIIDKLLRQVEQNDCFFWAVFEVIIDEKLERPMYSCENISEVLYRYRTYLSHELNRQATFVVKLNYLQLEKERLGQRSLRSVPCELFDLVNQRWMPCLWTFEKAILQVHRLNEKTVKWKANVNPQEAHSNSNSDLQSLVHSWSIEEIYLYVGADSRTVNPFDMNEYRVLTILPPKNLPSSTFGVSFRFPDRQQMFSWYLELVRNNGHDKWSRRASRIMPDGVDSHPSQTYHTPSSSRKRSDLLRNKFLTKSCHVASNFCKQLRK